MADYWRDLRHDDPPVTLAPVYFTVEYLWGRVAGTDVFAMRL